MIALISDIHGNLEALRAVLADISSRRADAIYCLGDTVGYGPDPGECLDLVSERCSVHLMGNHDYALLNAPVDFNPLAEQAILYHQELLSPLEGFPERRRRWSYVQNLKLRNENGDGHLFVHASPRDPVNEYVLPTDVIFDIPKIADILSQIKKYCFVGHTHFPGVVTTTPEFLTPEEVIMEYEFDAEKAIFNIGSVGQPRDGDWRSCYVELHENGVRWRRVEYDYEETIRRIVDSGRLDPRLGERLRYGR